MTPTEGQVSERLVRTVRRRLAEGKQVRRSLPVWGRLAVDRPLPFLCVYRRPVRRSDVGTFRFVTSEASYLISSSRRDQRESVGRLASVVVETLAAEFGGFLILELWAGGPSGAEGPGFRIFSPREGGHEALTDGFEEALRAVRVGSRGATVSVVESGRRWPRNLSSLIPLDEAERLGCVLYGLEVAPVFRDPESGTPYPRVTGELRRNLSVALRRFFYDFTRSSTSAAPVHFHSMGRRAVVKAVREVDRTLAEVSEAFEFLLQLTPTNGRQAWFRFKRHGFRSPPALHYRPLLLDPVVLKRRLFRTPVERIEDPALGQVYRQKLYEVDRQITMLQDRNTPNLLHESIQLFGGVEDDLHALALELLERIPPRSREARSGPDVGAETFARRAREEIGLLRAQHADVSARVLVRPDVTGLLVSKGNLMVSADSRISASRVEALIQHEVGTHVLTYHNGRAQKLRLLSVGFTGCDALQEGLAVVAEYLVGGLSRPRLRLLAGRVVAVRCLLEGADFVETFGELRNVHGFSSRTAFTITVRVYRSGGLTKDAVYLRGLREILDYLREGGDLEPLFVGKIAVEHIAIIRELTWRGVLASPPLIPTYMRRPEAQARLAQLRRGDGVLDLLEGRTS
jgi:uncharacterized protein (TIGR02421 family)